MRRNEPQGVNSYLKTNVCVYIIPVFMKLPFNGCSFFGCFHIWPSNTSNTNCLDFSMQLELQTYNSVYSLGSRLLELRCPKIYRYVLFTFLLRVLPVILLGRLPTNTVRASFSGSCWRCFLSSSITLNFKLGPENAES